jgi:serine/threonine-protein kinase
MREAANKALRLAPDMPETHFAIGMLRYRVELDWDGALHEFRLALKGMANDADLLFLMAAVQRRLGNWDEFDAAVQKAIEVNPRDARLYLDLQGHTYIGLRRYDDAVRAQEHSLRLAPIFYDAAALKGWTYYYWHGQLDSLESILDRLPSDAQLGGLGTLLSQQLELLRLKRQSDTILHLLATTRARLFESQGFFFPTSLIAAWAYQIRSDPRALAAFDSARVFLDSALTSHSADWRVHAARGLALAGLHRNSEALREADWLQQLPIYRYDAWARGGVMENRARILAGAGDADGALQEIERLLKIPSLFSVHSLRLDPFWDPIRNHPRFQQLIRS